MVRTIQAEVKEILTKYPKTRDSNNLLYRMHLARHGVVVVSVDQFFGNFNHYKEKYGITDFDSITRIRRKIVESNPELGASEEVQAMRDQRQLEFFGFSKG